MKIIDIFKNAFKKEQPHYSNMPKLEPFDVKYRTTEKGDLQIDFYDRESNFKQFYDSNRLIISNTPLNIGGQEVYNCLVSWYSQNDCQILDRKSMTFESENSKSYKSVLAQIDPNLLRNDRNYCSFVMRNLLNRKRVEKYLKTGLKDFPKQPCGNYIGGVRQTQQGYNKFFSEPLGRAVHNSNFMINKRKKYQEIERQAKQETINYKKAQIAKLQSEIDDLSK